MPTRLLRDLRPDCYGDCQVACEPLRQPWCGHPPALCETFPANCLDTARKLPGNYLDDSPDAARTAAVIAKPFANHRANFGANFGADIHRRFVRSFPPTARTRLGSCSVIARMLHRMLRGRCAGRYTGRYAGRYAGCCAGCCAEIARLLLVLRPYLLIRGWCLTKLPAFKFQKAVRNNVGLNV